MADMQDWLLEGVAKWGDRIRAERLSRGALASLAGISLYKAEQIISYVRTGRLTAAAAASGAHREKMVAHRDAPSTGSALAAALAATKAKPAPSSPPINKTPPFNKPAPATDTDTEGVEVPTGKELDAHELLCHDNYVYNPDSDTYITFTRVTAPKPMVMSGDKHRALVRAYSNWDGKPATINQICREFQIPRPWLIEYLRIHGVTHDSEPFSREEMADRDMDDMVEEALQARRQSLYRKFETAKWKETQEAAEKWYEFEETVLSVFKEHLGDAGSAPSPCLQIRDADDPYALVMSPTDFHWGMYSWDGEVDDAYGFDVAERRLVEHTENILSRLPGRPQRIFFPLGSDFFHIDGQTNHTTKGTPQDIAGTPNEILVTGCKLTQRYIDLLRQVAPVEVFFMPGNHDHHNSRALMLFLTAWYRNDDDVTVHEEYYPRVYCQYGKTLIGFHHGDTTKVKDLGPCMAREARSMWTDTHWHIWFGGHLHTHHVQEAGGITHYQLPSLAGQDRWHAAHGYVDSDPSLVAYLIDRHAGPVSWVRSAEGIKARPKRVF